MKSLIFVFSLLFCIPAFPSEALGIYKFSYGDLHARVTLIKDNHKLMMYWYFEEDDSIKSNEMVEIDVRGQTRLLKKSGNWFIPHTAYGEYFLPDGYGNLDLYDQVEFITKMRLLE